jgi:hypothetical protein
MIHYLSENEPDNQAAFWEAAELEPLSGARIQTLYRMFGCSYKNVDFWVQTDHREKPVAALSRYGNQLSISDSLHADLDELEEFVRFLGGFTQVSCSPLLGGQLRDLGRVRYVHQMIRRAPPFEEEDFEQIVKPALSEVYELLCLVDGEFEEHTNRGAWHVHTSHLVRHKLGFCVGILSEGRLVSTGGVYNAGKTHAIIGGLATLPEEKGQGYGGLLCRYLTNQILQSGKIPALYAASESLTLYYNAMGYEDKGRWCEITVQSPQPNRLDPRGEA